MRLNKRRPAACSIPNASRGLLMDKARVVQKSGSRAAALQTTVRACVNSGLGV